MPTCFGKANFAVIGQDGEGGCGVLCWTKTRLDARRQEKKIQEEGGRASIAEVDDGELSERGRRLKEYALGLSDSPLE